MRRLELAAGIASLAAGAVHGSVAPEHFAQWWGYGVFFVAAGLAQVLHGLMVVTHGIDKPPWPWTRVRRPIYLAGIAGNLAIVSLWVVTRTVGIPWFGPEAGTVEPVGAVDVLSKALEGIVIVALARLWLLAGRDRPAPAAPQ